MKQVVLLLTLLPCAVQPAQGQGTAQFRAILTGSNEVPPISDPTIAKGTFTLDGTSLNFLVYVPDMLWTLKDAAPSRSDGLRVAVRLQPTVKRAVRHPRRVGDP